MKILVVYYSKYVYPLRSTIRDHLYCFERYTDHYCYYHNTAKGKLPAYLANTTFDVVIYHTTFLAKRIRPYEFSKLCQQIVKLKNAGQFRLALPQDEFITTDALCDFIHSFNITHVFTVAPRSEWHKIYHSVNQTKVSFTQILTGYLDEKILAVINKQISLPQSQPIDIGYRAWHAEPWLGQHGLLKVKIAEEFLAHAQNLPLSVDISTKLEDTITGNAWYEFLRRCKYTIGVEGGASLLDADGSLREQTLQFTANNPHADFVTIENACFPKRDGELQLKALSPRHLEACATKTCQILIEGEYNGILKPGVHYIPLKADFSNINVVLATVIKDDERGKMVQQAYDDIVLSGHYTYQTMIRTILHPIFASDLLKSPVSFTDRIKYRLTRSRDKAWWWRESCFYRPLIILSKRFAPTLLKSLMQIRLNWQKTGRVL